MTDTEKFYLKVKDTIATVQEKLGPKCGKDELVQIDIQMKDDGIHVSGNIVKKQVVPDAS